MTNTPSWTIENTTNEQSTIVSAIWKCTISDNLIPPTTSSIVGKCILSNISPETDNDIILSLCFTKLDKENIENQVRTELQAKITELENA